MALTNRWSEAIVFNVNCDCTDRYTPIVITWLNPRGGFDVYTFRLKSTRTITNTKKDWSRFLSRLQSNYNFTYQIGDRGKSVYSSISFETMTCVSTWMTEDESLWTSEIGMSTEVYRILDNDGDIQYIPVVVDMKDIEIRDKKGYSDRLISRNIEFTFANEIITQRG